MDFVCSSSAGYEKIALLMRNVSFFLTKTIMNERLNQQLCESLKMALQNEDVLQNTEGSSRPTPRQATPEEAAEVLALAIDQLPEIKIYLSKGKYNINERYYEEALRKYTIPDITKNIHKFPEKYQLNIANIDCKNPNNCQLIRTKFINWAKMILDCDYLDIYYKYNPKPPKDNKNGKDEEKLKPKKPNQKSKPPTTEISINEQIGENSTIEDIIADGSNSKEGYLPKLTGLNLLLQDELQYFARQLKYQIETDPENRFRNCHIKNRQDGNCQTLIQLRYLKEPPLTLKETSEKLKIKLPTISNHIDKKCKDLLRKIAKELGYE